MNKLQPGLGERLKYRRETLKANAKKQGGDEWRKWTHQAIADLLSVGIETYQRWEYGTAEPNLSTILRLAEIFEQDPAEMLGLRSGLPASGMTIVDYAARLQKEIQDLIDSNRMLQDENQRLKEALKIAQIAAPKQFYQSPPKPKK